MLAFQNIKISKGKDQHISPETYHSLYHVIVSAAGQAELKTENDMNLFMRRLFK